MSSLVSCPRPRVRVLCLPDIDKPIGGVKQLYRHVEHLRFLGWDAAIVTQSANFRPAWFVSDAPTISLQDFYNNGEIDANSTVLLLPETYLGVNLNSFYGLDLSSLSRVIFNQNAYYSYGNYSVDSSSVLQQFYDVPSVLQILSVSEDTHSFLSVNLNIDDSRLSRIINSIEPIFNTNSPKTNHLSWMPRKNAEHVQAILHGLRRSACVHSNGWTGSPLENISHIEVAKRLNVSRLFLAFGHPEGFGLPIAEAMASGCWVVGYSGGGGKELFRFGASTLINFGDWPGFITSIHDVMTRFSLHPRDTKARLHRQSLAVRTLYSLQQERNSIDIAWTRIAKAFHVWITNQ